MCSLLTMTIYFFRMLMQNHILGCIYALNALMPLVTGKLFLWYLCNFYPTWYFLCTCNKKNRLTVVSYRDEKVQTVAIPVVRSVKTITWHKILHPKRARVCDICHLHHSFILQSPRIIFVWCDMPNTPQLQSYWRWPLWRYSSPQDVSAGRCYGDNPWKFHDDVIV